MRVGFDARWYNESGVGTYIRELLKAFAGGAHDLQLVVFDEPHNAPPVPPSPDITRVAVRSAKFSLTEHIELRRLAKSERLDLFHAPYQYGAPLGLPCPLIVTVHDLIPFLFRTRSWPKQLLAIPCVKLGYRLAARRAAHVIADSHNTARDVHEILKVAKERISPIYLAASDDAFRSSQLPFEAQILAEKYDVRSPYVVVGSAGNWRTKNLETALHALGIATRMSGVHFQTVVYGPQRGLDVIVKRGGTHDLDLRRVGYLPVDDLSALFRHAHLFMMPSLYEGFGLPVVEAMSCACPVITSTGGSLGEVAGDGALVFDPYDLTGMARAAMTLLTDPGERDRWRTRAHTRAVQFSWSRTAEETFAVYRSTFQARAQSATPHSGPTEFHESRAA